MPNDLRESFAAEPAGTATVQAQSSPQHPPGADEITVPTSGLLAFGLIVLVIWLVRRLANPRKLLLAETPGRPSTLHPLHPLALFALMIAGGYVAGAALDLPLVFLALVAVQLAVLIACLLVAQQVFRRGVKRGMGLSLRRWKIDTLRGLLAFLAILPVAGITIYVLMLLFPDQVDKNIHPSLQAMAEYGWLWRSVLIASAVVLAPLAEEVLYRGILQSTLRKYLGRPWPAVLATSVFFAISHGQPLHWPVLFILSVVLGYNYERTGRLWSAIVLHAAFNAYNTWVFLQYHAS